MYVTDWRCVSSTHHDTGKHISASPLSDGVYNALQDSYVTINLTPTVHNFELDEQGRVVFSINYLAYIDEFFDQSNFNIFAFKLS